MLQCRLGFHRVLEATQEIIKIGSELYESGVDMSLKDVVQGNDGSKTMLDYLPRIISVDGKTLNKITGKGDTGKQYCICLGYPLGSYKRKPTFGELVEEGISPLTIKHAERIQYMSGSCERCLYFAKDKEDEGKGLLSSEEEVERMMEELM
ncbi:MAG: hypothetical protein V1944_02815 [Candidatus Aenigmatarchaeota archaeon]